MSSTSKSGIQTTADGSAFIPSSKRADGSTRKEIRVRPGYRPPEDVETYKNRSAEAWKNRGKGGVPGVEETSKPNEVDSKSKNAKRREAARKKVSSDSADSEMAAGLEKATIADDGEVKQDRRNPDKLMTNPTTAEDDEGDRQKKIRNALKKLKAVRELKEKRNGGEKLSHDQLLKIGKEPELVRDLRKLQYDGPEMADTDIKAAFDDEGSVADHSKS